MGRIATILEETNPWWRDPDAGLGDVRPIRRQPAFSRLRQRLFRGDRRRGVLVVGLRWVGKTELARQVAASVLAELPGTQLAYASADQPRLRGALTIDEVLTAWDTVRRRDVPALLVLDEAHRLADLPETSWNWARQLKGVIDEGNIEVLATGSDAGRLREAGAEGAGRWEYLELEPLSFAEFRQLRAPGGGSPLEATRNEDLMSYLRVGGFPDFALHPQHHSAMEGLQHYARDILLDEMGDIRQHTKVEHAFAILMDLSGSNLDVRSLSRTIGAKADTVERWLDAMESVRLIQRIPRVRAVDRARLHRVKGQPRIHGADPGLVAAFSRWSNPLANEHSRGSLFEAAVLRHLREVARRGGPSVEILCLQPPRGRGREEVDFVLSSGDDEMFLIEVTSGRSGIDDKARFLVELAEDASVCGGRHVHAIVVAPVDKSTPTEIPAVEISRFLETLVPLVDGDPLEPLRAVSALVKEA